MDKCSFEGCDSTNIALQARTAQGTLLLCANCAEVIRAHQTAGNLVFISTPEPTMQFTWIPGQIIINRPGPTVRLTEKG